MENLKIYRKKLGLTQFQLAEQLGLMQTKLSKLESGDAELRIQELKKLKKHGLNIDWLITGKGEMLASSTTPTIPLYNIKASADEGTLINNQNIVRNIPCEHGQQGDFAIKIHGHSMIPYYHNGDYILCRNSEWQTYFEWGCVHIICTKLSTLIKKVSKNKNSKLITLTSYNDKFDDIELPINKITNAYKVVGILFSQREM